MVHPIPILNDFCSCTWCTSLHATSYIFPPCKTPLGARVQMDILRELGPPDRLRKSLDVVEIVLGFLTSGGGNAKTSLKSYLKKLKMERKPFSEKVTQSHIACNCITILVTCIGQGTLQSGACALSVADLVCWASTSHHPQWSGTYMYGYACVCISRHVTTTFFEL